MNSGLRFVQRARSIAMGATAALLVTHAIGASSQELKVPLSGSNQIPPVTTSATGSGTIVVNADRSVIVNVTFTGMSATVAHIHEAPAGTNGPIVVPLIRTADNAWSVPPGTRLTDAQYESFKAAKLYFNIHSEAHRGGEIRGQIKP